MLADPPPPPPHALCQPEGIRPTREPVYHHGYCYSLTIGPSSSPVTELMCVCPTLIEAKQTETLEFGLLQAIRGDEYIVLKKNKKPQLLEGFQQSIFERQGEGRVWLVVADFLVSESLVWGILCSCRCPCRSGCHIPGHLQQDKCYSLFCNFCHSVNGLLKFRTLRMNGLSCIFQAIGNVLLYKVQCQHDEAQAAEHKG